MVGKREDAFPERGRIPLISAKKSTIAYKILFLKKS